MNAIKNTIFLILIIVLAQVSTTKLGLDLKKLDSGKKDIEFIETSEEALKSELGSIDFSALEKAKKEDILFLQSEDEEWAKIRADPKSEASEDKLAFVEVKDHHHSHKNLPHAPKGSEIKHYKYKEGSVTTYEHSEHSEEDGKEKVGVSQEPQEPSPAAAIKSAAKLSGGKGKSKNPNFGKNGGALFGLQGLCITMKISTLTPLIPKIFRAPWNILTKMIETVFPDGPTGCFGDFSGKSFYRREQLITTLCNKIPVDRRRRFSLISLHLPNLPCGLPFKGIPSSVDATTCMATDLNGTFAIDTNAGLAACIGSAASVAGGVAAGVAGAAATGYGAAVGLVGGIGPLIATFADTLENIGIGWSFKKVFEQRILSLPYRHGNTVRTKDVVIRGAAFFNLGLRVPTAFMRILNFDIGKIIKLEAKIQFIVDFGPVGSVIKKVVHSILHCNRGTAKAVVDNALRLGNELSMVIEGNLLINLRKLTFGLLPNMAFSLANVSALITKGGNSGLAAGFYISISSNAAADLTNTITGIFKLFGPILKLLGLGRINIPRMDTHLKVFMNLDSCGFDINFLSMKAKCVFLFKGHKLSCKFSAGILKGIFTSMKKAGEFIFRAGKKLFDDTGAIITRISAKVFEHTAKAIGDSIKRLSKIADKARKAAEKSVKLAIQIVDGTANLALKVAADATKIAAAATLKSIAVAAETARKVKEIADNVARQTAQLAVQTINHGKRIAEKAAKDAIILAAHIAKQARLAVEKAARDAAALARHHAEHLARKAARAAADAFRIAAEAARRIRIAARIGFCHAAFWWNWGAKDRCVRDAYHIR